MVWYKLSLYWYKTPLTSKNSNIPHNLFVRRISKKAKAHIYAIFLYHIKNHKEIQNKEMGKRYPHFDALPYPVYIAECKYSYLQHYKKALTFSHGSYLFNVKFLLLLYKLYGDIRRVQRSVYQPTPPPSIMR